MQQAAINNKVTTMYALCDAKRRAHLVKMGAMQFIRQFIHGKIDYLDGYIQEQLVQFDVSELEFAASVDAIAREYVSFN